MHPPHNTNPGFRRTNTLHAKLHVRLFVCSVRMPSSAWPSRVESSIIGTCVCTCMPCMASTLTFSCHRVASPSRPVSTSRRRATDQPRRAQQAGAVTVYRIPSQHVSRTMSQSVVVLSHLSWRQDPDSKRLRQSFCICLPRAIIIFLRPVAATFHLHVFCSLLRRLVR
jgi:hypothetical protein